MVLYNSQFACQNSAKNSVQSDSPGPYLLLLGYGHVFGADFRCLPNMISVVFHISLQNASHESLS
jgi:hypothetical protein